jgi:hypothetical protein
LVKVFGVVHEHVQTAELVPDALCRSGDGGLIRDVELEGAGVRSDALRGRFPILEVRDPTSTVKPCATRSFAI